jgi:hypothetical protein
MTVGDSGDTFTVPSGVTLTVAGALNVTGTTSLADGTVAVAELDIDGATDIGAGIADADLFVVDDGAGGTNRKTAASRLKTFILADNSIDSDMYVDASIDNAHLADDAVGVAELSATGTASSSTFLRGDNSWAAAGGMDGTPSWYATSTVTQSISSGTWTTRVFGTEVIDTNSAYDTGTGIFTVPSGEAGRYLVIMATELDSATSGRSILRMSIGGTSSYLAAAIDHRSIAIAQTLVAVAYVNAVVGDTIFAEVYQDVGTVNTVGSQATKNFTAGWKLS